MFLCMNEDSKRGLSLKGTRIDGGIYNKLDMTSYFWTSAAKNRENVV